MNALNIALQQNQTTETELSLPAQLKEKFPLEQHYALQIAEQRQTIQNILNGLFIIFLLSHRILK